MHLFEHATSIIFVVDLDTYDQVSSEGDDLKYSITASLEHFDSMVHSEWFSKTSSILILSGFSKFGQKLKHDSLENYMPDYPGGADPNQAIEYVISRYQQLKRADQNLYYQLIELGDMESATQVTKFLSSAVQDTIIAYHLRYTIIL